MTHKAAAIARPLVIAASRAPVSPASPELGDPAPCLTSAILLASKSYSLPRKV